MVSSKLVVLFKITVVPADWYSPDNVQVRLKSLSYFQKIQDFVVSFNYCCCRFACCIFFSIRIMQGISVFYILQGQNIVFRSPGNMLPEQS
jgi:hypothetical protein